MRFDTRTTINTIIFTTILKCRNDRQILDMQCVRTPCIYTSILRKIVACREKKNSFTSFCESNAEKVQKKKLPFIYERQQTVKQCSVGCGSATQFSDDEDRDQVEEVEWCMDLPKTLIFAKIHWTNKIIKRSAGLCALVTNARLNILFAYICD